MGSRASGGAPRSGQVSAPVEVERVRIAHTLFTALAYAGLAYCVLALLLPAPQIVIPVVLIGVACTLALRRLADRGRVELAVLLLFVALSLMLVTAAAIEQNIGATPMYLPFLVAVAGASLYPRQVVWSVLGALVVLMLLRVVAPGPQEPTSVGFMLAYAFVVTVLVGVVSWVSAHSVTQALIASQDARRQAEQLAQELDERVQQRTAQLEEALRTQEQLAAKLSELTLRDPLTGLHNRRHLDDELGHLFAYAKRTGTPLSVAVADLDDFKSINDRFTHVVGDDVLRGAATVLAAGTRASDVLVRVGGEEFVLLMPGTTAADAFRVCERMRSELDEHSWRELDSRLHVTASFGVACSSDHEDGESLMQAADRRLFRAKRDGKNRVEATAQVA